MKTCVRCHKTFYDKMKNFYRDRAKPDGFEYECKICSKKSRKERYEKHGK